MGRKNKKKAPEEITPGSAELLFAKRGFKQALKDAKVAYRHQPSEDRRRVLEMAYLGRAKELHRYGLRDECRAVLETLLELGPTAQSVQRDLPEMLLAAGLFDRAAAMSKNVVLEPDESLLRRAADQAVLRPELAPASLPGIRQGAELVVRALAAVEGGNDEEAQAILKDISRQSPFADWRLFVRGLIAYYRGDTEAMRANWQRLDADRFGARIASALEGLAARQAIDGASGPGETNAAGIARLEKELLGSPLLSRLRYLQGNIAADNWRGAMLGLRAFREPLTRLDAGLHQRLIQVLYRKIARNGDRAALRDLVAQVDPSPLDPHWNRAWALIWEHPEHGDFYQADACWTKYVDDLGQMTSLSPTERKLAQALVWQRLGGQYVDFTSDDKPSLGPFAIGDEDEDDLEDDEKLLADRARAVECFNRSLELAPDLLCAYESMAKAQVEWRQPDQAARTYGRLIQPFPEHIDALLYLAHYHLNREEALEAREYAGRARRLRPLDKNIQLLVWSTHLVAARQHAIKRRWEQGRAELAAAEQMSPAGEAFRFTVRKAAFEFKAGNLGLGWQLVEQAKGYANDPAPALLALIVEAGRYRLAKELVNGIEKQWRASLKGRRRSGAAGGMAAVLSVFWLAKADYPSRDRHTADVVAYIKGCSRMKWELADLINACKFLMAVRDRREWGETETTLVQLADKGFRKFPDSAFFQCVSGEVEVVRGPAFCDRDRARRCFQRAIELAEKSGAEEDSALAERAKWSLSMLDDLEQGPFGGMSANPAYLDSLLGEADDDDDDLDDSDDEPWDPNDLPSVFAELRDSPIAREIEQMCRAMDLSPEDLMDMAAKMFNKQSKGHRKK